MDNGVSSYRRFLNGDNSGLEEIVRDYKDGLVFYLNGYVNNLALSEELMQEVFFKLITKKPNFKENARFKTWLYAVARNTALDYLRKQKRHTHICYDDAELLVEESDLQKQYIAEENKIKLHNALKTLYKEYYQVLWLIYFENFSNDEISRIMKKSPRQLKNLVYRAKSALKSTLEREGFTYEDL